VIDGAFGHTNGAHSQGACRGFPDTWFQGKRRENPVIATIQCIDVRRELKRRLAMFDRLHALGHAVISFCGPAQGLARPI
jgi:hypothetical protein